MEYTHILTSLISAIVGGLIATYLKAYLEQKKQIESKRNEIIANDYRSLLIFMACALDIEKKRYFSVTEQVENKTSQDYLNQIKEYYYHSLLYSQDEVILALKNFIESPTKERYIETAKEMRKALWGKNTKLTFQDLMIE